MVLFTEGLRRLRLTCRNFGWFELQRNLPSTLKYDGGTKITGVVVDGRDLTFDDVRLSNNVFNEPDIAISIRNKLILSPDILQKPYA